MDQKRILLLVGTLAVLLLAAWLSGYFGGSASTVETPELAIAPDDVNGITIRKGSETIVASLSDDGTWHLEEPVQSDVDTTTSSSLINRLGDIEIESLVSSRPERHSKFLVDSAQATYLRLDGPQPLEIYIGKTGPDFESRYVRLGNDDRVFLATGIPAAEPSLDRWKDKLIWSYPKESIKTVAVTTPESSYRLVSGEPGGWAMERDGSMARTDSLKVQRYLDRLGTVKADGFLLDIDAGSVVDSTTFSIEIQRIDGSESRLRIMRRESDAAAVANESSDVIKLFSYRAGNLAPEASDLLPE